MIAGPEGTRSACQLQLSSESSTVLVVIGNYKKLQQWIYDFCYQVGMHLEFRNRRRILNGPELIARYICSSNKHAQCTPNGPLGQPEGWPGLDQLLVPVDLRSSRMVCEVSATQSSILPWALSA